MGEVRNAARTRARLLAVAHSPTGRIIAEASRRASVKRLAKAIAERQTRRERPADVPRNMIQLAQFATLLAVLRDQVGLTGVKMGCDMGADRSALKI